MNNWNLAELTDDEDFVELIQEVHVGLRRIPRVIRPRSNHWTKWSNIEFFIRFRVSKTTAEHILIEIQNEIKSASDRFV